MHPDVHRQVLQESFETLAECVDLGFEKKQRTIGFHTSLAPVEMLEIYLHTIGVFPTSFRLHHDWMKSQKKIREKIPHDFSRKDEIVLLVTYIEKNRDILCYGKAVDPSIIREQLEHFWKLRDLFKEVGLNGLP